MNDTDALRILVIDDNERRRQFYATTLEDSLSVRVVYASNSQEAMAAMATETPPDLVLLDIATADPHRIDVLTHIKANHRLRFTPVIVVTATTDFNQQMHLLDAGADDFIERGAPSAILIARLRNQLRHKGAVDRLERLALDRDLFAAGVLQDIGAIKWTIVSLCRNAKELIRRDPVGEKAAITETLTKLSAHGTRLGSYASDVIQSVRETHRPPQIQPQDIGALGAWAVDVSQTPLTSDEGSLQSPSATVLFQVDGAMRPVLADRSFLRLAVLNIVQNAIKHVHPGRPLTISMSQTRQTSANDPSGRDIVTTMIRDNGKGMPDRQLAAAFQPNARPSGTDGSTSLGLALVAKVMAKMGGRVWAARPDDGVGTIVSLELPAERASS